MKVFYNGKGKARVFYKLKGNAQFVQNLKTDVLEHEVVN